MNFAAAILAAGSSTRLGEPKQLVRLGGESLLERAVRVASESGCCPVFVVLGANAGTIRQACPMPGAVILLNPGHMTGMASSIHAVLRALPNEADGVLLTTCDQPAVSAEHLRRLMAWAAASTEPVGSRYAGRVGVPALFPKAAFGALLSLSGDQGARALLVDAAAIDLPAGELDIDTPEMLEIARQRLAGG